MDDEYRRTFCTASLGRHQKTVCTPHLSDDAMPSSTRDWSTSFTDCHTACGGCPPQPSTSQWQRRPKRCSVGGESACPNDNVYPSRTKSPRKGDDNDSTQDEFPPPQRSRTYQRLSAWAQSFRALSECRTLPAKRAKWEGVDMMPKKTCGRKPKQRPKHKGEERPTVSEKFCHQKGRSRPPTQPLNSVAQPRGRKNPDTQQYNTTQGSPWKRYQHTDSWSSSTILSRFSSSDRPFRLDMAQPPAGGSERDSPQQ